VTDRVQINQTFCFELVLSCSKLCDLTPLVKTASVIWFGGTAQSIQTLQPAFFSPNLSQILDVLPNIDTWSKSPICEIAIDGKVMFN